MGRSGYILGENEQDPTADDEPAQEVIEEKKPIRKPPKRRDDAAFGGNDMADMEAYALASVCEDYNVPFRCFKYISDDGNPKQWEENCKKGVELFKDYVRV